MRDLLVSTVVDVLLGLVPLIWLFRGRFKGAPHTAAPKGAFRTLCLAQSTLWFLYGAALAIFGLSNGAYMSDQPNLRCVPPPLHRSQAATGCLITSAVCARWWWLFVGLASLCSPGLRCVMVRERLRRVTPHSRAWLVGLASVYAVMLSGMLCVLSGTTSDKLRRQLLHVFAIHYVATLAWRFVRHFGVPSASARIPIEQSGYEDKGMAYYLAVDTFTCLPMLAAFVWIVVMGKPSTAAATKRAE